MEPHRIEIRGELAGILELCDMGANQKPGGLSTAGLAEKVEVVAGVGFTGFAVALRRCRGLGRTAGSFTAPDHQSIKAPEVGAFGLCVLRGPSGGSSY